MATMSQNLFKCLIFMVLFVVAISSKPVTIGKKIANIWYDAHATFYGDMSGRDTMRKYNYI